MLSMIIYGLLFDVFRRVMQNSYVNLVLVLNVRLEGQKKQDP